MLLIISLSLIALSPGHVKSMGWHKHDCKLGDQQSCLQQSGCIWQPVQEPPDHSIPWCYYWTNKFDCFSDGNPTKDSCEERGCLWEESAVATVPWCFYQMPEAFIDCHPDKNPTKHRCLARGCLWLPTPAVEDGAPHCVFQGGMKLAGYDATECDSEEKPQSEFLNLTLKLARRNTPTIFGHDYDSVLFVVKAITAKHLRVFFSTKQEDILSYNENIDEYQKRLLSPKETQFEIQIQKVPFGFVIRRKNNNYTIIDTRNIPGLTLEAQFLNIPLKIPDKYIYGFGENAQLRLQRNVTWDQMGFFARDYPPRPSHDSHQNLYSVHPFYLGIEPGGKAHAIFFNNLHALSIALQNNPGVITYRSIGGMPDFHIFLGDDPNDVIAQYVALIGKPALPPYWGLGFQLSRWGYKNPQDIKDIVQRVQRTGTPLDIQYIDIDYMDGFKDFTVSPKFSGLSDFAKELHKMGLRLVLNINPTISSRATNYKPLEKGLSYDVFVKNSKGHILEGVVWPGPTYFTDFTHPNATKYWYENLKEFHNSVPFDGVWYDMNEASNFVSGSQDGCPHNALNNPPYIPITADPIYTKALCLDALHYKNISEYELHSLYGYYETKTAHAAQQLLFLGKRPFLLSRSTAPGSGVHTAHWSGDVFSEWRTMRYSIINMIQFSMFGIPFTGTDICGFLGNSDELMCVRWQQLGAFYPFSRNHNAWAHRDQDPAAWRQSAQDAIRKAILIRYKYLPYMYTLFVRAHLDGSTVVRALFFEFPGDQETHGVDDQFILGNAIMVAPVHTTENRSTTYFPAGRWYALEFSTEEHWFKNGEYKPYQYDLDKFGLFARGGSIIPWQEPSTTTVRSRRNPFGLVVNFDEEDQAKGELYWDDGESVNSYTTGEHLHFKFEAIASGSRSKGFLTVQKDQDTYVGARPEMKLNTVQLRGLRVKPTEFRFNGEKIPAAHVVVQPNGWYELTTLNLNMLDQPEWRISWK